MNPIDYELATEEIIGEQKLEAGVDPFTLNHEYGEPAESDDDPLSEIGSQRVALADVVAALNATEGVPGTFIATPTGLSYREQNISDVQREAQRIRVRNEARALVAAEDGAQSLEASPIVVQSLDELAKLPPEPPGRIEGLMPWQSSLLLVAMMKTGKTTWLLNLVWSLLTGSAFLGRFNVRPVTGSIVFLNYELSPAMFTRWALDVGIPADRFHVVNLRGKPNPLSYDKVRQAELARQLRELNTETIIIDPFSVAYPGESENDPGEVRGWLEHVNHWAREEVGALDLIIADHMGKAGGETARGASSKQDWADSIVQLVKGSGDDENTRYMKAFGRDVDVAEDGLLFDPVTRHLSLSGNGSRRDTSGARSVNKLKSLIVDYFQAHPEAELSGRGLTEEVGGQRGVATQAAKLLAAEGILSEKSGPRNARLFSLRKEQAGHGTATTDDRHDRHDCHDRHAVTVLAPSPPSLKGDGDGDGHSHNEAVSPSRDSQGSEEAAEPASNFQAPKDEGPRVFPFNAYCVQCEETFGPNLLTCPDCKQPLLGPGVEVPK